MNRPVAGVGDGTSPQEWFRELGFVTKFFLVSTLFTGICVSFGIMQGTTFIFYWPNIWNKFELWRLVTPFVFAGSFSFQYAMHLYVLYQNSVRYEENPYNTGARGTSADYLWMIILSMAILCVAGYFFHMTVLSDPIVFVIMYVYSRRNPDNTSNMYGFKFKTLYLPWIYVAIRLLFGNSIVGALLGIAVGHIYYFLVEVLPHSHNIDLIRTPEFCISIVEYFSGYSHPSHTVPVTNMRRGEAVPANATRAPTGGFARGSYNWGSGRVLGRREGTN